jgi:drug/metabolite transporter (DMT)-like permease
MSVPAAYFGVILIWATTPLAVKWSGAEAGFLFGAGSRMLIGALLCLPLLWLWRMPLPWHRAARQTYFAVALMIYGGMSLTYWGAQFVPSGLISVVFGLTPFVTSLLAAFWLGERLTPAKLLGIVLGISGLALIFRTELVVQGPGLLGLLALLGAVLLHTVSGVWIKRLDAGLSPLATTAGGLWLSLPPYALTWLISGATWPAELSWRSISAIAYLGVFGSVLGFIFYYYVLNRLEAGKVALITLITPLVALYLGQTLNGEHLGNMVWWGSATVLAGLILHQWGDRWIGLSARYRAAG